MSLIAAQFGTLYDAIETDVQAAWTTINKVYDEDPRLENSPEYDYAIIDLDAADDSWDSNYGATAQDVGREWKFKITGRWRMPNTNIMRFKVAMADALTARLCAGPNYANLAFYPFISGRILKDQGDQLRDNVEITIEFTCYTTHAHH